ncbi:MAG: hypothetical protein J6R25_09170, partial [Bacteroidales bacterium]|nr:hypothetical protein [Bacteroidales bacterium]
MLFSIAMLMAGNSMEALAEGSREDIAIMEENMVQEPEKPELLLQDDEISRYGAKTTLEAGEKTYKPYQSATYELVY